MKPKKDYNTWRTYLDSILLKNELSGLPKNFSAGEFYDAVLQYFEQLTLGMVELSKTMDFKIWLRKYYLPRRFSKYKLELIEGYYFTTGRRWLKESFKMPKCHKRDH